MFSSPSKSAAVKDGIVEQIGEQIKALQIGQQNADLQGDANYKVTSRNIHLQCLLDLLDHVLLHGLINVENGYWPFVMKITHSETVKLISRHPQVLNDLDRGRVWVFVAVCEGLLESYIRLFMEGQKDAKKFYTKEAFVRDKERLVMLQTLVSGLDYVPIVLDMSSPYLGYGGLPAPLSQASSSSPRIVVKNGSRRGHSRESSISASSSVSSSSTVQATTSPCLQSSDTETFELLDQNETSKFSKDFESNGVLDRKGLESEAEFNQPNEFPHDDEDMASKRFDMIRKPFLKAVRRPQTYQSGNTRLENTAQSDGTTPAESDQSESKVLGLMDPHLSTVDEDLSNDFRTRLGSNLSEISMEDMDLVVHHEHIKTRRIMKKKARPQRKEIEEDKERNYPSPDDFKDDHDEHEEEKEGVGVSKLYTCTSSYLSDYMNDSESVTSSVVSGDSLDQFCRDADFGSLNNLSSESTVQTVVTECRNEQAEVKEKEKKDEEKPKDEEKTKTESEEVANTDYEGIILGLPKRPSLQDIPGNSCDIKIDANTILLLSLEVFKNSDEQFHRMIYTSTGHHFGQLNCAHLLLTDFAVYLLRRVSFREETSFHTDVTIEYANIKTVEIGLNCQLVTVTSKKEHFSITFADEAVSRSFVSSLTSQVSRCCPSMSLSNLVNSSALQQESGIVKWMAKDKNLKMTTQNTSCFSLVRWCGLTGLDSKIEVLSFESIMEGNLEYKQHNYLRISSKWTKGYFVLTNGTLWQYLNQNDKDAKNMVDLRGLHCGGCRQVHDPERPYAFEIVSSDGTGSLLVLAAQNEHDACEWIFKICQSMAESYDDDSDRGVTVMKCFPCCLITTKEKIVICLAQPNNENEYKYITSCPVQNITKIFVDNSYRNYCIVKFDHSEVMSAEGSWFVWFNTEFELRKFETAIAEAWREMFQIDLQFLVLGNNATRQDARERAKVISRFYTEKM